MTRPVPPLPPPAEDRALSPYTGLTRAHWEAAADALLAAVRPYATPGQALIPLPGARPSSSGPRSDGLEGYARTFLLAALRIAGAGGDDPDSLLDRYAQGLAAGTAHPVAEPRITPDAPESWPPVTDRGQAMVEAAAIALGLRLTRRWLWDRLDDRVRERAADWLAGALRRRPWDNNWWLFPLTVGGFLAETEGSADQVRAARAAVDRGLARIERWWLGDGWYTDGRPRAFDHYNGWALHLYPVLHAQLAADPGLLARYGPRLRAHLEGATRMFGADGAPMHQGRSLSYRFAAAAAPWLGALTGHTPLGPGATRRLASGALRYFLDRGAAGPDGLLSLGWHGPYPPLAQPYSGPASPYWAAKGFLGLLLPAGHPVWTAVEEPLPVERADAVTTLPGPGWLLQSTAGDGIVRLHNHGSDNQPCGTVHPDDPLYARFAYSTGTGPTPPGTAPDNHFGLVADGGTTHRGPIEPLGGGPGWAASAHRPRTRGGAALPGVTVTSVTLAHGADEIRAHLVHGARPGTGVRLSGWATSPSSGTRSALLPLHGFPAAERAPAVEHCRTAYGADARCRTLTGTVTGECHTFVALARLAGPHPAARHPAAPYPRVRVVPRSDGTVAVDARWADGRRLGVVLGDRRVRAG
ncbi:hypothetical protein ACZ90_61150 [Streptomyces albus subsp. albus]|nr:hypothetical protein ACZ90_61150 [Streptomyces albus subsp. albus]